MAALRALGKSIENSGIDDTWIEADVCGLATTRWILKCDHYKRSLRAHVLMYMALYELPLDKFFKEKPHIKSICSKPVNELQEVCARLAAYEHLCQTLTDEAVLEQLKNWEAEKCPNAMLKSMVNYLHHVETILLFVEPSRNSDITLYLQAGQALSKLFFALDRIKYKCLWPR